MSREILLADPNPLMQRIAAGVLGRLKEVQITPVATARDALDQLSGRPFAAILTSDRLPDMDAVEFCKRLREQPSCSETPLAILCGPEIASRELLNVQAVLRRPFHPDVLAETVERLIPPVIPYSLKQHTRELAERGYQIKNRAAFPPSTRELSLATHPVTLAGNSRLCPLPRVFDELERQKATGVFIAFTRRFPVEVWFSNGRILLCTTRDLSLYCKDSPARIPESAASFLEQSRELQRRNACPIFLDLLNKNCLRGAEAVNACRDHGQRLFASLWCRESVDFEFESHSQLPGYLEGYPSQPETATGWLLRTLRYFNDLDGTLLDAEDVVVAIPAGPGHPAEHLRLTAGESQLLDACAEPVSLAEAGARARLMPDAAQLTAHRMLCMELLKPAALPPEKEAPVDSHKIVSFPE